MSGGLQAQQVEGGIFVGGTRVAGDRPILIGKSVGGSATLRITGLINCVGVVIKVRDLAAGGYCAVAGGHFTTPTMATFTTVSVVLRAHPRLGPITQDRPTAATLTSEGQTFISRLEQLTARYQRQQLIVQCHTVRSAGPSPSIPEQEATIAAQEIIRALGLGGSTVVGGSVVSVRI